LNEPRGFQPFERSALAQSIGARFEQQVARDPDRLAVKYGAAMATYAELNADVNRLAHAILAARGEGSEPVAIVLEQGIPLLAAVLGALKAGKLYVPLEIASPRDRLATMLRDSRAQLAIASASASPLLRELAERELQIIDPEGLDPSLPLTNPALAVPPDAPAYIYYTTGSTGTPQGVVDSHRNVLHNVMRYTNGLRIASDDRLTLLQSPSFSGAVSSMFAALLNGAASFPFDIRQSRSAALADYILRERITIYHSVPTIFRSFLREDRRFPSVRIIRLEGDQATVLDVELYRRHFARNCVLVNGLGTTETGIVRRHFIRHDAPPEPGIVPVGYAVEDLDVLILNEDGHPLPPGSTGEIAVCSDYLALGYWHRPDLTNRAFVRVPEVHPKRMYRTGDLGRMRSDGCLEHLGRSDFRVKIRGETVDIADVEAALHQLPMIREVAVDARVDGHGEKRLFACFVAAPGHAPTVSAIRKSLASALPPPFVPSWFEQVEALPLNENLKIDRRALPDRSSARPRFDSPYVAPQDPTQARVAHIWEALLGIAPIGIHDDFLDLGGDSLLATQMVSMVADALGFDVPLSVLTAGSTVAHIAATIAQRERAGAAVVPLRAGGTKPRLYFLHGDYLGAGAYCNDIAKCLDADQPFFALTPCGIDGGYAPDNIEDMAEGHLRALRGHQPQGPYLLGGNCNGGLIALEMAARLVDAGERVDRLVIFRASARNVRWRPLLEPADRIVRWLDCRPATRRAVARRLRWFAETWTGRGTIERLQLLARKAVHLAPALARSRRTERDAPEIALREPRSSVRDRDTLIAAHGTAAADYIPRRYRGRIDLLWPAVDAESPLDALTWWRTVSPDVRLEIVPGDHLTAITVHAQVFAQSLTQCLAQRLDDDPPAARSPERARARPASAPSERMP
jgi:amino acid adenylation domain-containing protein